jgi:hypothetical protein
VVDEYASKLYYLAISKQDAPFGFDETWVQQTSQFLESDNLKVKLPVSLTISPLLISLT